METKVGQTDFSGGLNTNPRVESNQLQECTNIDLRDFGKAKPAYQDTLIKTQADITAIGVIDEYVYYLVDDALLRIKNGNTQSIGTIGKGIFYAHKWEDIHLIVASDKTYKVLDGALTALGTAAPTTAPTLALSAQNSLVIDDMEDHTTWAVSGAAKADDATNVKVGTNSMKVTPSAANTLSYVTKTIAKDLTQYADGTTSEDDDLIALWVYISDHTQFTYLQLVFDINTGDFKNDKYVKTIPILPVSNNLVNEDLPQSFVDPVRDIDWDSVFTQWKEDFDPDSNSEFDSSYIGKMLAENSLATKQTTKKIGANLGQAAWHQVKIRKSEFLKMGADSSKNWSNVAAVKITVMANNTTCEVSVDDLKLIGGGKLDAEKYKVSYSYVSKYSFDDGTVYSEESKLSSETEITNADRQNIIVSNIVDSSDSQVTHKRIYIRGGGLELRHKAGEIETGTTTFTTDKSEIELVVESAEDCRKNGVSPTSPVHSEIVDGKLFIAKNKTLYWSRTLIPYAFMSNENIVLPYAIKAIYRKGSNLSILMETEEVLYVNPGYSSTEGGYLHYAEDPQGCIATQSAEKGFHLSEEGIVFFTGQTPQIISDKIRSELLSYSPVNRRAAVGAYLRGSYYLCIPGESVMYEFDKRNGRYIKYDTIKNIAAGNDGILYIVKTDGIYSFETDTTKRKSFAMRTQDIVTPDDMQNRNIIIDADFGTDAVTAEYYIGNTVKNTKTFTTSNREKKVFPITQEPGYRISFRLSRAAESTYVNTAIYGVYIQ